MPNPRRRFRKRPVTVYASQWFRNGDHADDRVSEELEDPWSPGQTYIRLEGKVVRFYRHPDVPGDLECEHCSATMHHHGWIDTYEGGHTVCPGDWIITGVAGEVYPCKPHIFDQTYDEIDPLTNGQLELPLDV